MAGNDVEIDVNMRAAQQAIRSLTDAPEDAGKRMVSQLSILAEDAMKAEAPEGAGIPDWHLRTSIRSTPERPSLEKTVMPRKRTDDGWLLHRAIVGNPSTPTYTDNFPPVWTDDAGVTQGPIAEWAEAKLGDRDAAWPVAQQIFQDGHVSFPQNFVTRSRRRWQYQVEEIAGEAVREAIGDQL